MNHRDSPAILSAAQHRSPSVREDLSNAPWPCWCQADLSSAPSTLLPKPQEPGILIWPLTIKGKRSDAGKWMNSDREKQIKLVCRSPSVLDPLPTCASAQPLLWVDSHWGGKKLFPEPPNSHYLSEIELFKISVLSAKKIIIGSCIEQNVLTAVMFR